MSPFYGCIPDGFKTSPSFTNKLLGHRAVYLVNCFVNRYLESTAVSRTKLQSLKLKEYNLRFSLVPPVSLVLLGVDIAKAHAQ